jgi:hypothetical protein
LKNDVLLLFCDSLTREREREREKGISQPGSSLSLFRAFIVELVQASMVETQKKEKKN